MKSLVKKLIPKFLLNWYHAMWPFLGALVYRFPSKKLKVIGVTGTNGKTSVVHMASYIFESAGYKTASISTLRFKIGEKEWKNKLKMTMPGRMKIHKFMRDAVNAGCNHLVMEITSEGIKQNRHKFIKFDTAVFTNLTPEHIESHGSFENYKKTKGKFFALPHKNGVVNLDDKNSDYFLNFPADKKITYSFSKKADIGPEGIELNMIGKFNISNAMAAIGVGLSQNISKEKSIKYLQTFKGIPGRMEIVLKEPLTIVDYAHTPDALEKVYKAVSEKKKADSGRMVCVFGSAGGGRDKWKRPQLGEIADKYCDKIILTDEDPYDENPNRILTEIESGITNHQETITKILDRRKAIHKALQIADKNDIVVITGKGAEPLMVTAHGPIEWDDREVVREEYKKL